MATPRSETVHFHHAGLLAYAWFAEYPETPERPPADDLGQYYG